IHNFHSTHNYYPPSRIRIPSNTNDGWATWAVLLLPYLEQDNLYGLWNQGGALYDRNFYALPNTSVIRTTPVKVFFCPSRRDPMNSGTNQQLGPAGDYACVAGNTIGPTNVAIDQVTESFTPSGPMIAADNSSGTWRGRINYHRIRNGASSTIFIGEKH